MTNRKTNLTKEFIADYASGESKFGRKGLESFKNRFEHNPLEAFEWSKEAISAAARVEVGETLKAWLTMEEATVDSIVKEVERMVLSAARFPNRSTSPVANFVSEEKASAWANFLAKIKGDV